MLSNKEKNVYLTFTALQLYTAVLNACQSQDTDSLEFLLKDEQIKTKLKGYTSYEGLALDCAASEKPIALHCLLSTTDLAQDPEYDSIINSCFTMAFSNACVEVVEYLYNKNPNTLSQLDTDMMIKLLCTGASSLNKKMQVINYCVWKTNINYTPDLMAFFKDIKNLAPFRQEFEKRQSIKDQKAYLNKTLPFQDKSADMIGVAIKHKI